MPFVEAARLLLQTDCAVKVGEARIYNLGLVSYWLPSAATVLPPPYSLLIGQFETYEAEEMLAYRLFLRILKVEWHPY